MVVQFSKPVVMGWALLRGIKRPREREPRPRRLPAQLHRPKRQHRRGHPRRRHEQPHNQRAPTERAQPHKRLSRASQSKQFEDARGPFRPREGDSLPGDKLCAAVVRPQTPKSLNGLGHHVRTPRYDPSLERDARLRPSALNARQPRQPIAPRPLSPTHHPRPGPARDIRCSGRRCATKIGGAILRHAPLLPGGTRDIQNSRSRKRGKRPSGAHSSESRSPTRPSAVS
jgi:hypothetical protein